MSDYKTLETRLAAKEVVMRLSMVTVFASTRGHAAS